MAADFRSLSRFSWFGTNASARKWPLEARSNLTKVITAQCSQDEADLCAVSAVYLVYREDWVVLVSKSDLMQSIGIFSGMFLSTASILRSSLSAYVWKGKLDFIRRLLRLLKSDMESTVILIPCSVLRALI
ncbi:hypothetical protein EVAR_58876_1 [Eumeta japonica]|uniref:Uncharacterized protein n=1 Tax=Eumeta variegata TaxID=151549 RepID=A0A4C1ZBW6_EUMVA|nr:hypothetical protein EVAR_58876_1 [Eumeta japonica]